MTGLRITQDVDLFANPLYLNGAVPVGQPHNLIFVLPSLEMESSLDLNNVMMGIKF